MSASPIALCVMILASFLARSDIPSPPSSGYPPGGGSLDVPASNR